MAPQSHSNAVAADRLHPSVRSHSPVLARITSSTSTPDDPKSALLDIEDSTPATGAHEVSHGRRLLQVVTAVVYCLLSTGIVFGFAAFKPVLVAEGVYREHCTFEELHDEVRICYQQELRLNFMFTLAAVATNVCALLVGTILDRFGPRVSGLIGSVLFGLGCLGFVFAERIWLVLDPYPPAYLLLALGGPFIFISSFHLANAFPRRSGLVLSLLTGAFDASSAIFLVYRLAYQSTSSALSSLRPQTFFTAYLVVPIFIFTTQMLYMPRSSYKTTSELVQQAEVEEELLHDAESVISFDPSLTSDEMRQRKAQREDDLTRIDSVLGGKDAAKQRERQDKDAASRHSGVWGAMHGNNTRQQLCSLWFWGICGFTVIQMTRINYFVATLRAQYDFLLNPTLSLQLNSFFDVCLPLGGLFAIPFIGLVLDTLPTLTVLLLLVTLATAIGLLGLFSSYPAALIGIVLFTIYRPFYYTVVSDYCVKVFGVTNFGKVYGAVICLAGTVNFCAPLLEWITWERAGGDPRPVDAGLLMAAVAVGVALCWLVWRRGRGLRRRALGVEAMQAGRGGEEESLMPGGSGGGASGGYGTAQ